MADHGAPPPGWLPPAGRRGGDPLVVGLVNNMPDAALNATERQFRRLVAAAAGEFPVRWRIFYLPELPRTQRGRTYVEQHYENIVALSGSRLDGLIVTGTEPRAADLRDEPYWRALAQLVDWAEECTLATVWSCLAAHAAVLHADGIGRQALPRKLSGVYECRRIADHPVVRGTPRRWWVSHSRCNDVPAKALTAHGYRLLSWSPRAGADLFIRQRQSLFVYFQGHPEYDPESLAREYRRDVCRFLAGERDVYPDMPHGYFDAVVTAALAALQQQALRERSLDLLASYPAAALAPPVHMSADVAVAVYRRWLGFIAAAKGCRDAAAVPLEARSAGSST